MIMSLLIELIPIITVYLVFNLFKYFWNNQTKYFGKSVELWLINHSLTHLSTFLALHPVNAHTKVQLLWPILRLYLKFNFDCPDYGCPLSVAFFTIDTYLYLSWTEFSWFIFKCLRICIRQIVAILLHSI
jgi:hypothetical protein